MSFRSGDLAGRMARGGRNARDGFVRETLSLPREQARAKAKAFLKSYPKAAIVEYAYGHHPPASGLRRLITEWTRARPESSGRTGL
jgi:hypothetical protein